jgi:hypothetical protein
VSVTRSGVRLFVLAALVGLWAASLPAPAAQAACKSGLTNEFSRWWGTGKVVTTWCYSGGQVTWRRSVMSGDSGWAPRRMTGKWTYSRCHSYDGYPRHNCLTRAQFTSWGAVFGGGLQAMDYVCVHTRVYGNGGHRRRIIDGKC